MAATTEPVGHPTMRADDIGACKSPSFSPCLHEYLNARGLFFPNDGLRESVYIVRSGTRAAQW